jgi:hypothetical protein
MLSWLFPKIREIRNRIGQLHFRRYRIVETPFFNVYLHRIFKKDEDYHLHNHPWNFIRINIWGSYTELIHDIKAGRSDSCWRKMMWYNHKTFHKILELRSKSVTSLVFTGPRSHEWGYLMKDRSVMSNSDYRKLSKFERKKL